MATQTLSARKQIANAQGRITKRIADNVADQAIIDSLKDAAADEPEEFDGASVPTGSNVVITVGAGDKAQKLDGVVIARREATAGTAAVKDDAGKELVAAVKGAALMFKVRVGTGFEEETKIVFPAQIVGYRTITK